MFSNFVGTTPPNDSLMCKRKTHVLHLMTHLLTPFTLLTHPPAAVILDFSNSWAGLWSWESAMASGPRHSTALESPAFATYSWSPCTVYLLEHPETMLGRQLHELQRFASPFTKNFLKGSVVHHSGHKPTIFVITWSFDLRNSWH